MSKQSHTAILVAAALLGIGVTAGMLVAPVPQEKIPQSALPMAQNNTNDTHPFPTQIDSRAGQVGQLIKMLLPGQWQKPTDRFFAPYHEIESGGYSASEHRNVLELRATFGWDLPVIPGRMLPHLNECLGLLLNDATFVPPRFCMADTTVTMQTAHLPFNETDIATPDPQGAHVFGFFPRRPLPPKAADFVGETSDMCGTPIETLRAAKVYCVAHPNNEPTHLFQLPWGRKHGTAPLPQKASASVPKAYNRPFATANDRLIEAAHTRVYEASESWPFHWPSHPAVPGRFIGAIKSCMDWFDWVQSDQQNQIDLSEYLLIVHEVMPQQIQNAQPLKYLPNIPIIKVKLVPQPMPLAHFSEDAQKAMKAEGRDRAVPQVKGQGCAIDPRTDKVLNIGKDTKPGFWAADEPSVLPAQTPIPSPASSPQ